MTPPRSAERGTLDQQLARGQWQGSARGRSSRIDARSWSPLWATPPPMITSDGLKKFTTLGKHVADPPAGRLRAASTATGSPNAAARATSSAVSVNRARRAPPAAARCDPRGRPPRQGGRWPPRRPAPRGSRRCRSGTARRASSTTWMCPTSPALPCAPRWSRPSEMMPAPMPVPILITTTFSWPCGDTCPPLPERQDVDVVVDPHWRGEAFREALADRVAVPAGHDRRRDRPAGCELHRVRARRARRPRRAGYRPGRVLQRLEQLLDPTEARPRGRWRCRRAPCNGRGCGRPGRSRRR